MRRSAGTLLVAMALAVTGCGGGDDGAGGKPASDEDQIRAVVADAYGAFAEGDAEGFCSRLTADYLDDFESNYAKCDDAGIAEVLGQIPEDAKQQLESPEIDSDLMIDGDAAYPTVNGDGLEVEKEGDTWKLDDFDIPGQ
jgi:ketosteroid isomerase-like protein